MTFSLRNDSPRNRLSVVLHEYIVPETQVLRFCALENSPAFLTFVAAARVKAAFDHCPDFLGVCWEPMSSQVFCDFFGADFFDSTQAFSS